MNVMESHKKGQTIHSDARNIVNRIIQKCDEEAEKGQLLHMLRQSAKRAVDYTGMSVSTIKRIRKENLQLLPGTEKLSSPGKKRPRNTEKVFHCSEEDRTIIRNIIYEFYTEKKVVPTAVKLLGAIRERINFPWKIDMLYKLLKSMGFKYTKSNSIRKILIERPNIVKWRAMYLKAIKSYRTQNRNIIYMDETWIDNSLCFSKCW